MKKVLIVNSMQSFLDKERSIINRSTIQLFATTSPKEALAIHEKERVDLVVADLEMAEMTGDTLCMHLRKNPDLKQVAVILVCFNIKEALDRVAACKANDWVAKPLQPDELLKKVERLLSVQSRKAFRALVSTTLQNTAGNQKFFCYSQNISTSGILIETDKHLEKGERLECSFYLPGSDQLIVQGTVMRVIKLPGRFQYGIQFNNLSRQYSQLVNNFVENSPTR